MGKPPRRSRQCSGCSSSRDTTSSLRNTHGRWKREAEPTLGNICILWAVEQIVDRALGVVVLPCGDFLAAVAVLVGIGAVQLQAVCHVGGLDRPPALLMACIRRWSRTSIEAETHATLIPGPTHSRPPALAAHEAGTGARRSCETPCGSLPSIFCTRLSGRTSPARTVATGLAPRAPIARPETVVGWGFVRHCRSRWRCEHAPL